MHYTGYTMTEITAEPMPSKDPERQAFELGFQRGFAEGYRKGVVLGKQLADQARRQESGFFQAPEATHEAH